MNTTKRLGRLLAVAVVLLLATAGILRLTGKVRYLVTNGISMSPLYRSGDLVVVRNTSRYRAGQIAAYHSQLLNTTVLHRIVSTSGGQYTFKGDHNTWTDPEHPAANQLLGRAWLHIPHGGIFLAFYGIPVLLLAITGIICIVLLSPEKSATRRKRPNRTRVPANVLHRRVAIGLVAGELCLAPALVASLALGSHSERQIQPATVETSTFTYNAQIAPNPVYPTGQINTGDPIFVRVVPAISVSYLYQTSGARASQLTGTTALQLNLASPNGWHTTTTLGAQVRVLAGRAQISAPLDLGAIESTLEQVRSLTGVDTGTVNAVIHAVTRVTGAAGASDHLDIPLSLQMTPTQVSLTTTPQGPETGSSAVITSKLLPDPVVPTSPTPPAARVARRARIPLLVAVLIVAVGLALHFYPTPDPGTTSRPNPRHKALDASR
ncbi:MAG TPA: S24 family peptidase [Acidimicrobiales bacterium]|nr:S24 family peptidase [Acidimicrobiales bacterium]